jgi:cytochrome c oxidase cbb3-type subunit 4
MDINTLRGLITAVLILVFLGIVAWAWSSRRKGDFDAAARLPLEEDEQETGTGGLVK